MATHNKHAASEDQLGILHNAITRMFNKKAEAILNSIEEDDDAAIALVNGKDLAAMAKWVLDNGITCVPAAATEESDLSKKLKKIRAASSGHVIQFTKEG